MYRPYNGDFSAMHRARMKGSYIFRDSYGRELYHYGVKGMKWGENLMEGSTGDSVKDVQQRLRDQGYDVKVDGIYGKQTAAAVRAQQQQLGQMGYDIKADGIYGEKTHAAESDYEDGAARGNVRAGEVSDDVKSMQEQLRNAGFNIKADGVFGKKTAAALKEMQAKLNEAGYDTGGIDAIYGKKTRASLSNYLAKGDASKGSDATQLKAAIVKRDPKSGNGRTKSASTKNDADVVPDVRVTRNDLSNDLSRISGRTVVSDTRVKTYKPEDLSTLEKRRLNRAR